MIESIHASGKSQKAARWTGLTALIILFAATRLYLVECFRPPFTDVKLYCEYAMDFHDAARAGQPFYRYHENRVAKWMKLQRADGRPTPGEWRERIEYPPLAVSWMVLVSRFVPTAQRTYGAAGEDLYIQSFRRLSALVDAVIFAVLIVLTSVLFRDAPPGTIPARLAVYILCGVILGHLLYDRLDIVLAALILISLALLLSRWHYAWSFAVLMLGAVFKLVPLILAPLWIVGSLPCALTRGPWTKNRLPALVRALAARSLWMGGFLLLWLVPGFLAHGTDTLRFLQFQTNRGIEVESLFTLFVILFEAAGQPFQTLFDYGCICVRSADTSMLAQFSFPLTFIALALAMCLFLGRLLRWPVGAPADDAQQTVAGLIPSEIAGWSAVLLLLFICACRCFSPQYLLWVIPLFPLLSLGRRSTPVALVALLVICIFTTTIWPYLFTAHIMGAAVCLGDPVLFSGPTRLGKILLIVRNLMVAGLTAFLILRLAQPSMSRSSS